MKKEKQKTMGILLFVTDETLDATFCGRNAQRNGNHDSRETCGVKREITSRSIMCNISKTRALCFIRGSKHRGVWNP